MTSKRTSIRLIRYLVQCFFLGMTLFIGYRFYSFVLHFESPGHAFVQRPPSVDGFMPIAGLMSFRYFLSTGIIEPVHPAAFVLFTAIILVSFLLKKGFCGWICPIGTVSQYLWMAGYKIFGKNFRMPGYADMVLRSVKYLLMVFFLLFVGVLMKPDMASLYFNSDYFKVADIKTMKFFTGMSSTTFWSLLVIGGFSLIYKNFWCRYLCPYGALLGLLSCGSPVKIKRYEEKCVHCSACTKNCPSQIFVENKDAVSSAECFNCMTCVSRCPSEGALDVTIGAGRVRRAFHPYIYVVALIVIFYLVIGIGILSGNWYSGLPYDEYRRIIPDIANLHH